MLRQQWIEKIDDCIMKAEENEKEEKKQKEADAKIKQLIEIYGFDAVFQAIKESQEHTTKEAKCTPSRWTIVKAASVDELLSSMSKFPNLASEINDYIARSKYGKLLEEERKKTSRRWRRLSYALGVVALSTMGFGIGSCAESYSLNRERSYRSFEWRFTSRDYAILGGILGLASISTACFGLAAYEKSKKLEKENATYRKQNELLEERTNGAIEVTGKSLEEELKDAKAETERLRAENDDLKEQMKVDSEYAREKAKELSERLKGPLKYLAELNAEEQTQDRKIEQTDSLIAIASGNSIHFLDRSESDPKSDYVLRSLKYKDKRQITREGLTITALCVHDDKLYDGAQIYNAGFYVFDTASKKAINYCLSRNEGQIESLFSYDGKLTAVFADKPHTTKLITTDIKDIPAVRSISGRLKNVLVQNDKVYGIVFDQIIDVFTGEVIARRGSGSAMRALCSHDGRLYDATEHEIRDTFSNGVIARRSGAISLVSHNGKLFDLAGNNNVYETFSGEKVGQIERFSADPTATRLVSINGKLYYAKDCLVDVFSGQTVFDSPVNDIIVVPRKIAESLLTIDGKVENA